MTPFLLQIKRERALEDAKRQERAAKIKEENRIRRGIILAVRNQAGAGFTFGSGGGGSTSRSSAGGSDFGLGVDAINLARRDSLGASREGDGAGRQMSSEVGDGGGFFVTQQPGE
jgi:hypothetical protein